MTMSETQTETEIPRSLPRRMGPGRLLAALSFRNVSAVYIFVAMFVLFSVWIPSTFLTTSDLHSIIDNGAVTALTAMALVLPLAAGAFDLAIGAEVGFGAILVAWLLTNGGMATVPAIALTLLAGGLIGAGSGLLVTRMGIDSFIATLGISSILLAAIAGISGSEQILNLPVGFQAIATSEFLGFTYPVWIMLAIAIVLAYVLDLTPVGRRVYATGGNLAAARLAGVRTSRTIVLSLVACGVLTAFAGILVSSNIGAGDPTIGPPYLLPAYAAAFLGSTQFRGGRYNIWGTVLAVYVLAVGVQGLQLAGAPVWIPDLFNGVALLLAVGMSHVQGTARRARAIRRSLRRGATD